MRADDVDESATAMVGFTGAVSDAGGLLVPCAGAALDDEVENKVAPPPSSRIVTTAAAMRVERPRRARPATEAAERVELGVVSVSTVTHSAKLWGTSQSTERMMTKTVG